MLLQSEALVLLSRESGENDRLITALTKEYGLLRAFARGAKKNGSRLQSASQMFCYGRFEFKRWKDALHVTDARPLTLFFGLHKSCERLALAEYCSELATELSPCEEPAPEQLRLLLNTLHYLSGGSRPLPMLKAIVELRLMCLAGYRPDLEGCRSCGAQHSPVFRLDYAQGRLLCQTCLADKKAPFPAQGTALAPQTLQALRLLCEAPLERAFRFAMPAQGYIELTRVTERYAAIQLGKRFKTLEYLD
ncbi:MAG: DNA repair protein RecO [Oscillospiraceae bacterium]|jgi:DNA repair protein RecO (recombination protein O)|nr:DNA repair protein RecO [Oscillospiraceae bacterium]